MYITGETTNGIRYLPSQFDQKVMVWNYTEHKGELTPDYVESELGVDLDFELKTQEYGNAETVKRAFIGRAEDIVLDYCYAGFYPNTYQIVQFKIARTSLGTLGYQKAVLAQVQYMLVSGADMYENEKVILSERAKSILHNMAYSSLGFKGRYLYGVNPDSTADDGLYNEW